MNESPFRETSFRICISQKIRMSPRRSPSADPQAMLRQKNDARNRKRRLKLICITYLQPLKIEREFRGFRHKEKGSNRKTPYYIIPNLSTYVVR